MVHPQNNSPIKTAFAFLKQFIANPREVGAIFPSSGYLARAMLADLQLLDANIIVEFGPGTGSFTRRLVSRIPASARYVVIEANADFAHQLRAEFPKIEIVQDYAHTIKNHLGLDHGKVDIIVSGLPFTIMPQADVASTIAAAAAALRPGGAFRTFIYSHTWHLPTARRLYREIHANFREVTVVKEPRNLPPALVIKARK